MPKKCSDPKNLILMTLFISDEGLSWSELLEQTKLSKGALSKHLNNLLSHGTIKTEIKPKRPRTILYYMPGATEPEEKDQTVLEAAAQNFFDLSDIVSSGRNLKYIIERDKTNKILTDYLMAISGCIIRTVFASFYEVANSPEYYSMRAQNKNKAKNIETHEEVLKSLSELWEKNYEQFDLSKFFELIFYSVFISNNYSFDDLKTIIRDVMLEIEKSDLLGYKKTKDFVSKVYSDPAVPTFLRKKDK
jgi:DNA-binding transcriptional regulator GbsR (MarR family)